MSSCHGFAYWLGLSHDTCTPRNAVYYIWREEVSSRWAAGHGAAGVPVATVLGIAEHPGSGCWYPPANSAQSSSAMETSVLLPASWFTIKNVLVRFLIKEQRPFSICQLPDDLGWIAIHKAPLRLEQLPGSWAVFNTCSSCCKKQ